MSDYFLAAQKFFIEVKMNDNVIEVKFNVGREVEVEMVEAIKEVFYSFAGKTTVASALGALVIAKYDLEQELLAE